MKERAKREKKTLNELKPNKIKKKEKKEKRKRIKKSKTKRGSIVWNYAALWKKTTSACAGQDYIEEHNVIPAQKIVVWLIVVNERGN